MPHSVRSTGRPIFARLRCRSNSLAAADCRCTKFARFSASNNRATCPDSRSSRRRHSSLAMRRFARRLAHPIERGYIFAQSGDQIIDQLFHARFGFGREGLLHVDFAERFAKIADPSRQRIAASAAVVLWCRSVSCHRNQSSHLRKQLIARRQRRERDASANRSSSHRLKRLSNIASTPLKKSGCATLISVNCRRADAV